MRRPTTHYALICAVFLVASSAATATPSDSVPRPQRLSRLQGETDRVFSVRVLKLGDFESNVLTTTWNGARTIFVDYLRNANADAPERPVVALLETGAGSFRKLQVTLGETEGGEPDVAAIGFANADRDLAKELILILVWRQVHAFGCGPIYEVRILDDADHASGETLRRLPISKKFGEGCADQSQSFKFTTVGAVKAELGRLGY